MKQVCLVKGAVEVVDVPAPVCEPGSVLIRTACSLISTGTELSVTGSGGLGLIGRAIANPQMVRKAVTKMSQIGVRQTMDFIRARESSLVPLGYSAAGEVVEVGAGVRRFKVGDHVACAGAGDANHAEFNVVPQNLVAAMPDGLDFQRASFATVGAIALHGVRRLNPTLGERVVVVGLGLIGQMAAQLLTLSGCRVFGVDPRPARLSLAVGFGADATAVAGDAGLAQAIDEWTGGIGADAVLITASASDRALLNQTLDLCRKKGRVVLVGDVPIRMNRDKLYRKEIDFLISCSYGPGRYDPRYERQGIDYPLPYVRWTEGRNLAEVLRLIATSQLRVRELVGASRPIDQAAAAYQDLKGEDAPIAALLEYGHGSAPTPLSHNIRIASATSATSGQIVVGIIGAGMFFRSMHLPNLRKRKDVHIKWIATRTGASGAQLALREQIPRATTSAEDVLTDPEVSAVLIATRHDLHASLAVDAVKAGKHVFVEKPLGLSVAECDRVVHAVAEAGVVLAVGFNRRMAPLAIKAKAAFRSVREPKTMVYRINAGVLPADHWSLDEIEGGGRLFGEGVHFFDFARWVFGATPVGVSAAALRRGDTGADLDNTSISVAFADGSVATVVYTGQGASSLPKERIEIFGGGEAVVIDDFARLERHGTRVRDRAEERLRTIDKGHAPSLDNFLDAIAGRTPVAANAEDGYWATWCAEQAARQLGVSGRSTR